MGKGMKPMSMSEQDGITVQGMILRSAPQGDFDKRLVILTKERGRITVFARGARRGKNALAGKTNPFSFGEFVLGTGSSAYYLKQAEITNYFMEMTLDYACSCYGFYFLEFAEHYSREGYESFELLGLLYQTLRALEKGSIPYALIRVIFELKVLVINGEYPEVFNCIQCGEKLLEGYFHVTKGGTLCPACGSADGVGIYVERSALYTMQYIISAKLTKLYTFVVNEEVLAKLVKVMKQYCFRYVDREFKSLAVLEELLALDDGGGSNYRCE